MLASFVLTMAIAAPVPAPAPPVASGPVARLMGLKANPDGKITITVRRVEKGPVALGGGNAGGAAVPAIRPANGTIVKMVDVELGDVKDLKITTADGKKVEIADAMKRLKDGAVVVVSTDGKPVSPNHLKLFKDDVLVLTSPDLVLPANSGPMVNPRPFPGGRPVPVAPRGGAIPAPGVLPAQPGGVIQIQIQPGQIQVIPLQPAPAPAPEK